MENINCVICLEDKTEIKCKYCSVSFHISCFKKYNNKNCPQCKKQLPNIKIDNCFVCLKFKTEIKCRYCYINFHVSCFPKYNQIECPHCKKELPEFLINDLLKYSRCLKNMFYTYMDYDQYENVDFTIEEHIELDEKINKKIKFLSHEKNLDIIQKYKFDIKTFLLLFYKNYTMRDSYNTLFEKLTDKQIFNYCIFAGYINNENIEYMYNQKNIIKIFNIELIIETLISKIYELAEI